MMQTLTMQSLDPLPLPGAEEAMEPLGDLGDLPVDDAPPVSPVTPTPAAPAAPYAFNLSTLAPAFPAPSSPTSDDDGMSAHVTIWNRRERRKIAGNAAPLRRNVARYLSEHPDCEEYLGQDRKPGSKPKKTIKRRRPAAPVLVYATAAAAAAHASGRAVYEVRANTSSVAKTPCYDYRACRQNRCGIHAPLHPALRGPGSSADQDAVADPARFDSDFGRFIRAAQDPDSLPRTKGLGTLPKHIFHDMLPAVCSDFSDDDSLEDLVL